MDRRGFLRRLIGVGLAVSAAPVAVAKALVSGRPIKGFLIAHYIPLYTTPANMEFWERLHAASEEVYQNTIRDGMYIGVRLKEENKDDVVGKSKKHEHREGRLRH